MAYPVPENWSVFGTLNKNGVPFFEGKVYADNKLQNGEFEKVAESGISIDGSFTLSFSRSNFQNGDTSLEYPTLRIRVEDYQGNTLWISNQYNKPDSALNVGAFDILKTADQNGDCRVFGTVKNEQGNILADRKIVLNCLQFEEIATDDKTSLGEFKSTELCQTISDVNGNYEQRYSSSLLPAGLLLDSKEDYGKDKVSLYAEAYEKRGGEYFRVAIERLVFNGKREQEINFVLKSKQESFKCEFEKLDSVLKVYQNAIISRNGDKATFAKKIDAIGKFLKSNTEFPLVVGRERVVESKVRAYFTAYSLFLQLDRDLQKKGERDAFITKDCAEVIQATSTESSQASQNLPKITLTEDKWQEIFFALSLREGISTLYGFIKTKPTVIQKVLFGAVSDGLICSVDTTAVLNLWKFLVNGGTLQGIDGEGDDSLSISQLLSLYIKKNLTIDESPETDSEDSVEESVDESTPSDDSSDDTTSQDTQDSETEEKQKKLPRYVAVENFSNDDSPSEQKLYDILLEAYYNAGADVNAFIKSLQADSNFTEDEVSKLKAVFDLNDFFEKFAPGVVCAYRFISRKENFEFKSLSDLVRFADDDWKNLVDEIAEEYYILYCKEKEESGSVETTNQTSTSNESTTSSESTISNPNSLPANFPGNNSDLKKVIYARKLSKLIVSWYPQHALLWNLAEHFGDSNWGKICNELMKPEWETFSLSNTDVDEFVGNNESFFDIENIVLEVDATDKKTKISKQEEIEKKRKQVKERIQQLQRLFHLTESAEAIAYLIDQGFKSAYQITTISENEFVARHGNGIGKADEARQIHRLAQNYMAEASLNIQAYVTSSIEKPLEESVEEPLEETAKEIDQESVQESGQRKAVPKNLTLAALPRALPNTQMLRTAKLGTFTNTAAIREATRDTVNWAGLFGNINFTRATQGQSILSASAYYVDLLKFLKKSSAYRLFTKRRPDYLDLELTKANAEIPMPTIDLGIELLECLVNESLDKDDKACVIANNNPKEVTAAGLRAEPLEFKTENAEVSIDKAAEKLLSNLFYPFQLPANFDRNKAKKILSNLSLHFYDIAEVLNSSDINHYERRELRLDKNQRSLVDLVVENVLESQFPYNTCDLWGLEDYDNEVLLLDKNSVASGSYIAVLRRVAVFLQRTGFTIQDLNEILKNENFSDVCYRPKDSEFYQLSNINGYEFAGKKVIINSKEVELAVDWNLFFRKMAALVHRKNILGWSLSDVLLTFDANLNELDVLYEISSRYGISVQDAFVLGGKQKATPEFINAVYQLPNLVSCICKNDDEAKYRRTVLKLLKQGLSLTEDDAVNIYGMVNLEDDATLLEGLLECYRYNLISKTFGISLPNLGKILEHGVWQDEHNLPSIRVLSDEWRVLSGTSIEAEFYLELLCLESEDEKKAAEEFAKNLVTSGLEDKPEPDAPKNENSNNQNSQGETDNTQEDSEIQTQTENSVIEDSVDNSSVIKNTEMSFEEKLSLWEENLKLFICAEFGIVCKHGDALLPEVGEDWKAFFESAKIYNESWTSWNSEKDKTNTEVSKKPELDNNAVHVYANLLRKVAIYNYTQNYAQGFDLTEENLDLVKAEYAIVKKLVYANYTTDRLLSGDCNLEKLSSLIKCSSKEDSEKIEDILAVEQNVVEQLRDHVFGMTLDDCDNVIYWLRFTRFYELYSKTHLLPDELVKLLDENDLNDRNDGYENFVSSYSNAVKSLENTVKSNTKESEWLKFAQEMNDDLRKRKRDALAAYICWDSCRVVDKNSEKTSRYPKKFVDENDIYAYYLMDVKMEPDMTISRIVQASASIQLFVQRAELGLEGPNVLSDEQREEWKWMKNYRVWEAARKVFLYPENWIASDLRDDKTPFFEELEERIQEFSDDHSNLEKALFEYLEKVREVSSIEIVGATKEDGGDEGGILYTLHIVGRTQGEPHVYYYRKYKAKAILSGEWTPWERLDVDVPSETVVPAIVNQRLYLLWPQITLGQRNVEATSNGGLETIEYYARIQICWTSYTGTNWTGTRMTKNAFFDASTNPLDFSLGDNEKIEDRYNLKTISSLDGVAVSIVKTAYHYQEYEEIAGTTEIMDGSSKTNKVTKRIYDKSRQYFKRIAIITVNTDGSDSLEIFTADYKPIDDFAPERTKLVHGVFTEVEEFTCGNKGFCYPEDNAILNYTPGLFRIVATNLSMLKLGKDDKAEDLPFFYMDGRRTFFVQAVPKDGNVNSTQKNYKFELLSHSLVDDFYKRYRDGGTKWLYTRETQALPISDSYYYSYSYYNYYFSVYLGYYVAGDWQAWDLGQNIFRFNYRPSKTGVDGPYPAPMVDFVWGGANAMYNWELFFYVPMLIAEKMIAEQSYEEALLWLQLVFDPRANYSAYERTKPFINGLPRGARYWKFLPFFANRDADKSILQMLGLPTRRDRLPDRVALSSLVDKWKNDPFNPHLIARYRNVAYQKYVVMKYLDTLIAWGDQEFTKDTTESVNLAIQFYLLAAELLGPKNAEAPEPEPASPLTASDLLSKTDDLGNAFIKYENSALIGKDKAKILNVRSMDERAKRTGNIVESMFYFSVPRNDTLFSYWDTIADRLYKIRNSLNIQGVKRTLALFAPPIDPGLLVKARAMGISIDSVLNSANEEKSIYRFKVIVKLAVDMAKDACEMGKNLLEILEKKDAEQLQVFKAKCDKAVIAETRAIHEMEVKSFETEKTRLAEKKTAKKNVVSKKKSIHSISAVEKKYQKLMDRVAKIQETVEKVRNIASATYKIPDFKFGAVTNVFGGPRFDMESLGGTKLAENLVSAAEGYAARFAQRQLDAAKTKLQGEFERRQKEWAVEDDLADAEIVEVEKQEIVNEIKAQQAERRQQSIEKQIQRSEEMYEKLCEKYTNKDLYIWLEKELGKVFQRYVALLVDVARMAEMAYHFEIEGKTGLTSEFMKNTYWDNFYKGLLAPERILLDLRRMEKAYLENDKHEMVITRPIRLSELEANASAYVCKNEFANPLTQLRTGKQEDSSSPKNDQPKTNAAFCEFELTENFFELEFDGHYFQRIKDVQIFVELRNSVQKEHLNAELTLVDGFVKIDKDESSLKVSDTTMATGLAINGPDLSRHSFSSEKSGIFEGCGAISKWSLSISGLELVDQNGNAEYPIEDVVIYLTYTARKGGSK